MNLLETEIGPVGMKLMLLIVKGLVSGLLEGRNVYIWQVPVLITLTLGPQEDPNSKASNSWDGVQLSNLMPRKRGRFMQFLWSKYPFQERRETLKTVFPMRNIAQMKKFCFKWN